ncbi:SDR family oxidoreductase [Halomonas denitrificans]|uniref:SDR family oxidoreductase n=1 Tax=Halomonas TaxID=2745 RepID=UPI001C9492CC|nr:MULTISPECIES: SDR family oxidoreductase [Halomonas]MBY5929115.1 SDR family oxidoreductase [Halomonas sp. DP8Y7-3]MCA0973966.1 SDR family oxidoreductase [Halomonas denitrificans]
MTIPTPPSSPVTLVTGGSGAIGGAVIRRLRDDGHRVYNLSLEASDPSLGAVDILVDLMDAKALREAVRGVVAKTPVSGLVNTAGFPYVADIDALEFERLRAMVNIHCEACLHCIQEVLPALRALGGGRIVNIGSRMILGRPGRTAYSLVKSGMLGVTRSLALELAPAGITVNMVSPGPIETAMFRQNHPPGAEVTAKVLAAIPVGRIGRPEDVANAVGFFMSPGSGFVTGQNLYVCGGGSVGSAHS